MAFLEIKDKKEFVLNFIRNSIVEKKVSLDEIEELQNSEVRRKKDWEEWANFQRGYRMRISKGTYKELDDCFESMNESHLIKNAVNDLDIQVMKSNFDRRTRYVRRLKYVLYLTGDVQSIKLDGVKCSMNQIFNILTRFIREDAKKELRNQLIINNLKLELNNMDIGKDNKYYLNDRKRKKIESEIEEYEILLERLNNGGYPLKSGHPSITSLCSESSINTYKSIYQVPVKDEFNIIENNKKIL